MGAGQTQPAGTTLPSITMANQATDQAMNSHVVGTPDTKNNSETIVVVVVVVVLVILSAIVIIASVLLVHLPSCQRTWLSVACRE